MDVEEYGPVPGRCRKGYKKNRLTKMCHKTPKSTSPNRTLKVKPRKDTPYHHVSNTSLKMYGPVPGRCRNGYKKNKLTKMCHQTLKSTSPKKNVTLKTKQEEEVTPQEHKEEEEEVTPQEHKEEEEEVTPQEHKEEEEEVTPQEHKEEEEEVTPQEHKEEEEEVTPQEHKEEEEEVTPQEHKEEEEEVTPGFGSLIAKVINKLISPSKSPASKKIESIKLSPKMTEILTKIDTPINGDKKLKTKQYKKSTKMTTMHNETFIKLLKELETFMRSTGEPFRARAYQKAAESIMLIEEPIISIEQVKGIPGIGTTILEKLQEYLDTGKIEALEKHRDNPIHTFTKIYGVGPKKAQAFINLGIHSLDELRQQQDLLNASQKLGLQYFDDLQLRIPRSEIEEYKQIFDEVFDYDDAEYHIVGSYRRGVAESGDIDVILTNNKPSILKDFVKRLRDRGVILHILADGKKKNLVIGQLEGKPARRLDFLYSPREEYPFALLYFTGSATFNVVMRKKALDMNYTLNEHGFHKMVGKVKGEKVTELFTSEKDIFDFLNIEYKEPTERKNAIINEKQEPEEDEAPDEEPEEDESPEEDEAPDEEPEEDESPEEFEAPDE